jgi:hypothetical protein
MFKAMQIVTTYNGFTTPALESKSYVQTRTRQNFAIRYGKTQANIPNLSNLLRSTLPDYESYSEKKTRDPLERNFNIHDGHFERTLNEGIYKKCVTHVNNSNAHQICVDNANDITELLKELYESTY